MSRFSIVTAAVFPSTPTMNVTALEAWMREARGKLSRHNAVPHSQ